MQLSAARGWDADVVGATDCDRLGEAMLVVFKLVFGLWQYMKKATVLSKVVCVQPLQTTLRSACNKSSHTRTLQRRCHHRHATQLEDSNNQIHKHGPGGACKNSSLQHISAVHHSHPPTLHTHTLHSCPSLLRALPRSLTTCTTSTTTATTCTTSTTVMVS